MRGPAPDRLEIRTDPCELRAWTRANLDGYWRDWVVRARRWSTRGLVRALPRRFAAGGVLGVSRLHYTLETGEIADKETAGEYALATFGPEWRTVVEDALVFWRGAQPPRGPLWPHPARRTRRAADFVAHVIDSALGMKDSAGRRG